MMPNPFEKFTTEEKDINIKALGGAKVRIRTLTLAEQSRVNEMMFDGATPSKEGVHAKITNVTKSQILAVSIAMVEPKMNVKDFEKLGSESYEAIDEIYKELTKKEQKGSVEKK